MPKPGGDGGLLCLQEVLNTYRRRWHGLLGGADVREGGDDRLDVCWQGCKHRVVEGEGKDAWEDGAVAASDKGCCWVDSHVELLEVINVQDGPLYISCDEVKLALVQHQLVALQAKDKRPFGTSGIGGGKQAALWSIWARNQGH